MFAYVFEKPIKKFFDWWSGFYDQFWSVKEDTDLIFSEMRLRNQVLSSFHSVWADLRK